MLNQGTLRRLTASARGVRIRGRAAPRWQRAALVWRGLWAVVGPVLVALVSAVALLLLLDWVVFDSPAVLPRLPTFRNDGSPHDKLLLAARYTDARVLYLGDSRIMYGIDPAIVTRECRCGPGYNAGFPGAEIRTTRVMAERLLEKLSPRVVVIGVSQWELSDNAGIRIDEGTHELIPPWRRAEFGKVSYEVEDIPEFVGGVWRLYKHRGEIRQALEVWAGDAQPVEPRRGYVPYSRRPELRDRDLDRREDQWFEKFSVEGRRAEALKGMIADLRRRGIRVVLVAPPLYPEFRRDVRDEVAKFRTALARLADQQGALLIDVTMPQDLDLDVDRFRDVVHLDEEGAERFSRHIGRKLRSDRGAN